MTQHPTTAVDPQFIEDAKRQIRAVLQEITQLSKSDIAPAEFHAAYLDRVVQGLAAIGGAIWTMTPLGGLELQFQINIRETGLAQSREAQERHGRLLQQVVTNEDGAIVAPHSGAAEEGGLGNPTAFLLVFAPLNDGSETIGLVEIFQRSGATPAVQRGYLRFLSQTAQLAGDFFRNRRLRHLTDRQVIWTQLETFTRNIHRSLNPREASYTIANEGRRLIECDRVTVAIQRGRRWSIEAISGQDTFDRRSNTVYLLNRLIDAVAATGEPLWYEGDTDDMPPQIEDAIHEYVDESQTKAMVIVPLRRPADEDDDTADRTVIGALVVEQMDDSATSDGFSQRVDVVADHSAIALANAMEVQSMFLMPVWRAIGKLRFLTTARNLPKTVLAAIAIVIVALGLIFFPANFELEGKGVLQPIVRRQVFAEVAGTVSDVKVRHESDVQKGEVLVVLTSTELQKQRTELQGRLETAKTQASALQKLRSDSNVPPLDATSFSGQLMEVEQQIISLETQLAIVAEKLALLNVTSPSDGQVVTWDVEEELMSRPILRGDVLMTIAEPDGEWELEILMPENRIGHIEQMQESLAAGEDLRVEFYVATHPSTKLYGTVKEIHNRAEVRGEQGNTVIVRVKVDAQGIQQQIGSLRQGVGVTARIYCGRRSIGYVWFHDVFDFVYSKILFRL